jgi:hypothetical protein
MAGSNSRWTRPAIATAGASAFLTQINPLHASRKAAVRTPVSRTPGTRQFDAAQSLAAGAT